MGDVERCQWAMGELYEDYHDREWGVPSYDDRHLFEMLLLEGAQAGLSWITILKRREGYRAAFDNFDPDKVARYGDAKKQQLLEDTGIIRNRAKVESAVQNARAFLQVQEEFGSFSDFMWRFVGGKPIQNTFRTLSDLPASTPESDAMSKEMKRRGFSFVGTTICYAHMQSVGMVNDHVVTCFRHSEVAALSKVLQPEL